MRLSPLLLLALASFANAQPKAEPPRCLDPRLEIVQFAASPDIVHPIAVEFDPKGRLLVVESHTHFRPKDYKGPESDRIRILEDTDGDGKADRFTTFYEGLKATMDLAVHPDGSVYVATRNEILRLKDNDGDGKADEWTRIMFLKTDGNYPHNGLSGLAFDAKGDLYFGLGENLGAKYELTGSDNATYVGGGEGGSVFWCTKDGAKLRRVATGFWNPFGVCRDVFGRIFCVDNDPDAMPPCRLVHVVEGGDYGFQFRYGRAGRHPFQAWNGELPGTLPYIAGVGEAPCEVLAYESDGLPPDYRGDLLVTSWGDHRLERYALVPKGSSFTAKKQVVIQGGANFRPVGLAVAPDGSLFMSDWVRRDYNLHGQGAVWHVRMKDRKAPVRAADPTEASASLDRATREKAVRTLLKTPAGIDVLKKNLAHADARVRAAALDALAERDDIDLEKIYRDDAAADVSAMAVRALAARVEDRPNLWPPYDKRPTVRRELLAGWTKFWTDLLEIPEDDPFLRQAAVRKLASTPGAILRPLEADKHPSRVAIDLFLALRDSGKDKSPRLLRELLADPIEDIRFMTARWIADDLIGQGGPALSDAMKDPNVNSRLYLAYGTAQARLSGEQVNEIRLADIFLRRALDDNATPASRVFSLRMVPTSWGGLQTEQLVKWIEGPVPEMRLEAMRALVDQTTPKRSAALLSLLKNPDLDPLLRREALTGLADEAETQRPLFLSLVLDDAAKAPFAADALRGLVNVPLEDADKERLRSVAKDPALKFLVDRVLGQPLRSKAEQGADVDAWLTRLEGPADIDAGRRVFFHPRLGGCYRCHRVDGRGQNVGPDLSTIGQRERKFILESILHPSRDVAPHFQTWQIETGDGKIRNGLLTGTNDDKTTFIDEKGRPFTEAVGNIVEMRAVPTSIMPEGLTANLSDQEIRDLLAFLGSRK
jgi:putative membrane-bound dehydrogenase-like protein